jgi:hypothetical protein
VPAPPPAPDDFRPVHVAEPEPEAEPQGPATLEDLAARFGAPRGEADAGGGQGGQGRPAKGGRDRSREAREKQAAILARLKGQGA